MAEEELHILQNGVPRSGNVWLFYLVRSLLQAAGLEVKQFITDQAISALLSKESLGVRRIAETDFLQIQPLRCFYRIQDVFRWPIEDLSAYVAATSQVASHSPWNKASRDVYNHFSHVLYIVRDPRDVALSMSRFALTPYNRLHMPEPFDTPAAYLNYHFNALQNSWNQHVKCHLANRRHVNMHVLFYEALVFEPASELARLATFLGLSLNPESLQTVIRDNDFASISAQQPDHTHRGVWGGWRNELSRVQVEQTERTAGPLLSLLGYPRNLGECASWSAEQLSVPE